MLKKVSQNRSYVFENFQVFVGNMTLHKCFSLCCWEHSGKLCYISSIKKTGSLYWNLLGVRFDYSGWYLFVIIWGKLRRRKFYWRCVIFCETSPHYSSSLPSLIELIVFNLGSYVIKRKDHGLGLSVSCWLHCWKEDLHRHHLLHTSICFSEFHCLKVLRSSIACAFFRILKLCHGSVSYECCDNQLLYFTFLIICYQMKIVSCCLLRKSCEGF